MADFKIDDHDLRQDAIYPVHENGGMPPIITTLLSLLGLAAIVSEIVN